MGQGRSKFENYFLSDREGRENIYQYIDRKVQPDSFYLCMCSQTVDKVVQYLYTNLADELKNALSWTLGSSQLKQINVKEILKSGSLGKSTAVKEKSDIDLIIFLNGISSVKELSQLMPKILSSLKKLMERLVHDRSMRWASGLEITRTTNFSLGLVLHTVNDDGTKFDCEMDLLPALDITASKSLLDIYSEMEQSDEDLRRYYSACLSRVQKKFVNDNTQPAKVKNLIRFIKFWVKVEQVPLRSYFVELLVIYNNRQHNRKHLLTCHVDFKIYDHLKECLRILTNCETLKITFSDNYDYSNYGKPPFSLIGVFGTLLGYSPANTNVQTVPYLLDPANPYMNVAPSPEKSRIVSQKAQELLDNWDRIFS
ncbi:2'-5'-oligoadenylate synthase 1A-like [Gigantopelta aegis]|uniref:2'-5'-oligoadenylate synthase 1A-like n=1 Tax=Gigantopelta aegis TaxID=1735272 RepID=UPI001B88D86A|nr:2'-5'-oligoadenylate synthase 1A-like [Gigantopelta aegis]XP_041358888.1 2'-5'-oligoadenylate synthase 1A-like [Gigantopelta aegis]XP_041358889.1 2'-5'-oligoadenylate synthase 1A-like [Gigantopelta aegis]XP_041358890.1 2'-5'-oligoadenylate synthase 1A-like [Gigantopelta aegis]